LGVGSDAQKEHPSSVQEVTMFKAFALLLVCAGAAAFVMAQVMPFPIEIDWTAPERQLSDTVMRPAAAGRSKPVVASDTRQASTPLDPARTALPEVATRFYRSSEPGARTPAAPSPIAASLAGDRVALARELQRELKRVGCYDGEVNGAWTPATRRAMQAFTERVNAALPSDGPDVVLLALVRDQQDKACGVACPAGQALAADGRCLPAAVLAARKAALSARVGITSANTVAPVIAGRSGPRAIEAGAPSPLASAIVQSGPPAPKGLAQVDDQASPTAAPGVLGLASPQPTPAVANRPRPARAAAPAQGAPTKSAGFGPTVLRQAEKNGF
jgi:hypothetical protein